MSVLRSAHAALLCFSLVLPTALTAQEGKEEAVKPASYSAEVTTLRTDAQAAVQAQEWDTAVAGFRKITELAPADARAWHMLGYSLHAQGKLDEALEVHLKAATFDQVRPTALYNAACVHALKKDADTTITYLKKAVDAGFTNFAHVETDPDMDFIRDDARFAELMKKLEAASASATPKLKAWSNATERRSVRVSYWGQSAFGGQFAIDHGRPEWKDGYAEAIESGKYQNQRWRLGQDFWTTLDTSLPLSIAGQKIAPGYYYLTVEQLEGGKFALAAIDPKSIPVVRRDAYLAPRTVGGIECMLEHSKSEKIAEKLMIDLKTDEGNDRTGTLAIRFGPHVLKAPFEVLGTGYGKKPWGEKEKKAYGEKKSDY